MADISKAKLAVLEEDFRSYHKIPSKIAELLVAKEWKPADENAWIKGSRAHTEKALTDLVKREDDKGYLYYSKLYADIGKAYNRLNSELQEIVDVYFWGDFNYLGWAEISSHIHCSTGSVYRKRYKILETLAIEQGIVSE
ncbi:transcriptional regulator [Enterococcus dongliensis]|uniref:transcriptional regulator n=1 Tax=Enterococcus dongliensis TaxID=2559925 RepID=UPI00288E6822|nr:transcriptional regulator [Enterococcus dongliensis]MDT2675034.1 transcriptional regulator [Enterococcus dongliensis]